MYSPLSAKLVPLAYGIQKLSILCTVEDEKVSIDDLSEKIQEIEDYVSNLGFCKMLNLRDSRGHS